MRIGLITYYKNGSFGAALQAYALQRYLTRCGHDVPLIQYCSQWPPPTRLRDYLRCRSPSSLYMRLMERYEQRVVAQFAGAFLKETEMAYRSLAELRANPPSCDLYLCGSDQIWNPWVFETSGSFDSAYFLDFGPVDTPRCSYASSFGRAVLPAGFAERIQPLLMRLKHVSVRELSAVRIVRQLIGREVSQVLDPTLLLGPSDYSVLAGQMKCSKTSGGLVTFIIGSDPSLYVPVLQAIRTQLGSNTACLFPVARLLGKGRARYPSVAGWLAHIQQSEFVLTDSYHAVVFAILYKRPFAVLLRSGGTAGRNDRLLSLLSLLGLESRMISDCNSQVVDNVIQTAIDWDHICRQLDRLREQSVAFLSKALECN